MFNNGITILSDDTVYSDKVGKKNKAEISITTNQQSPVTEVDRRANDKVQIELQELIYKDFGLYYERKRGEFGDGIRNGYIDRSKIIDREQFIRICLTTQNKSTKARVIVLDRFDSSTDMSD